MKLPTFRRAAAVAVAAALTVGLAACSSTGGRQDTGGGLAGGTADTPRLTVAMVTHAPPGDTFWDLIRAGAEDAAAMGNIELRYSSDPQAPNQANLIQSAVDARVDGIALTLSNPSAMSGAVRNAQSAGIPISGFNAGFGAWQDLGIQQYFGQDETVAGRAAGERLNEDGVQHVACVIQAQGQVQLEARCAGVRETFNGTFEIVYVNGEDMPSVQSTLTAKLQTDPNIDGILTLGAPFAFTAVQSADNAGSEARIFTFDTNAALVGAIESGDVEWAIDQQPYLQGFLAVNSLWLYINNGNAIGGGMPTLTGPAFIDQDNIADIAEYARRGTR